MRALFNHIAITGISCAVPKAINKVSELGLGYSEEQSARLIQSTGISEVRTCDSDQTVLDLAFLTATHLIAELKINISEIDGLVFVTQTPDYRLPNNSAILQNMLRLEENTVCIDLNAGCSGYIQGLYQAGLMISSGGCGKVLLLCGDNISKFINQKDSSISVLFGDAASATLVEHGADNLYVNLKNDGGGAQLLKIPSGGSRDLFGTKRNLEMDGFGVLSFALSRIPKLIDEIIQDLHELNLPEPSGLVCHQANKILNDALLKKLKFNTKVPSFLAGRFGNTGSASIPMFISEYYHEQGGFLEDTLLCGFGVGLSWGGAVVDLAHTKILTMQHL